VSPPLEPILLIPDQREVVVRRRICLVGAALGASSLAFGVAPALAAKKRTTKPAIKAVSPTCTTNVGIMIPSSASDITPPVQSGNEYGTASCRGVLGRGIQSDTFNVLDSGDTVATYTLYFHGGTIHGKYDLTPQEGSFNFLTVDYLGTLTIRGGNGAFLGAEGTGTMTCDTIDGIHTTCTDKLKLKFKGL
jgi:hypothetical protein